MVRDIRTQQLNNIRQRRNFTTVRSQLRRTLRQRRRTLFIIMERTLLPRHIRFVRRMRVNLLLNSPMRRLGTFKLTRQRRRHSILFFRNRQIRIRQTMTHRFFTRMVRRHQRNNRSSIISLTKGRFRRIMVLLSLGRVTVVRFTRRRILHNVRSFLSTTNSRLHTIITRTTRLWARLQTLLRQAFQRIIRMITCTVRRHVNTIMTTSRRFIPTVRNSLVRHRRRVFTRTNMTRQINTFNNRRGIRITVILRQVSTSIRRGRRFTQRTKTRRHIFNSTNGKRNSNLLRTTRRIRRFRFTRVTNTKIRHRTNTTISRTITITPDRRFRRFTTTFSQHGVLPLVHNRTTIMRAPLHLTQFFLIQHLRRHRNIFNRVQNSTQISRFSLINLTLRHHMRTPARRIRITFISRTSNLFNTNRLNRRTMTMVRFTSRHPTFTTSLASFPLTTTVRRHRIPLIPLPFTNRTFRR